MRNLHKSNANIVSIGMDAGSEWVNKTSHAGVDSDRPYVGGRYPKCLCSIICHLEEIHKKWINAWNPIEGCLTLWPSTEEGTAGNMQKSWKGVHEGIARGFFTPLIITHGDTQHCPFLPFTVYRLQDTGYHRPPPNPQTHKGGRREEAWVPTTPLATLAKLYP